MKNSSKKKPSVLIADPDTEMYAAFMTDPMAADIHFEVVGSGMEAQQLIKENRGAYSACLISPDLLSPCGISVIKCSLIYQPMTPVYFLESLRSEINIDIQNSSLGITASLAKPFDFKTLVKTLGHSLNVFDVDQALSVAGENSDKLDEETSDSDPNFRSIKANQFVSGSKSLFDIYVKLRADKYVKIIQGGDIFESEKVLDYIKKGVSHFYLRKEALETYVNYCDKVTEKITQSPKIGIGQKFEHLFNQADVTLKSLSDLGVAQESLVHAQKFLKNVCSLVDEAAKNSDYMAKLMAQIREFEHVGGVVMVAGIIAKHAGIESEKGIKQLGMAAFLHDVGMISIVKGDGTYDEEEEKAFDEEEILKKLASKRVFGDELTFLKKLWKDHAALGAEQLARDQAVPETVCQIIQQHHAHRDKSEGILPGGAIHPMAEIVEISDEFVRLMNQVKGQKLDRLYMVERITGILSLFPKRTQEPFKKAFGLI